MSQSPSRSRLRGSLAACTAEGLAAELLVACCGAPMVTAWALYLGASPVLLGALWALPFLGHLCQLPAAWMTSRFGRRRIAILGHGISRQAWLVLAVLPFLPISTGGKRAVLVTVVAVASVLGAVGHNAWLAWMGDMVPSRIRGRYFGRRAAAATIVGALASLLTGVFVDAAGARERTGAALGVLALLGWIAAMGTAALMVRQHDPPDHAPMSRPVFRDVAAPFLEKGARRLLVFKAAWNCSLGIVASLTAITMLETLHIGFTGMAVYTATVAAARTLLAPMWGRAIDRVRARPVLVVCTLGSALSSALWLVAGPGHIWPIALDAVFSGLFLGGHQLASFAIPLAVSPRVGRPWHLAAFVMVAGLSFGTASIAGGAAMEAMTAHGIGLGAKLLFATSTLGRLLAAVLATRILEPGARPVGCLARLAFARKTAVAVGGGE